MSDPRARPAYLDHAATTPVLPAAAAAFADQLARVGNASSLHTSGRRARRVVEEAREQVAGALGCGAGEVVFTSGGTESDNLAVKGLYWQLRDADPRRTRIIASAVEHHAVLDVLAWLAEHEGAEVELVGVDAVGRLDVAAFARAVESDPHTVALATVMWANNEIGTVQPVSEVVAVCRAAGVPVHSDAVQAVGALPVDFAASGLDAMTVSGHKVGGPVGAGALLLRRGMDLVPVLHGGGQERGVRSGTVDVAAVRAFAVAVEQAVADQPVQSRRLEALRDDLVARVRSRLPDVLVTGDTAPGGRLPGNAHLVFPGCEGDSLLYLLDAAGVECSTGSACQAGVPQPSHVLAALGTDPALARGALRFSLGHTSTGADVDAVVTALGPVVRRARGAQLAGRGGG